MIKKRDIATGTQAAYNNLWRKNNETFYVCTDTHNIYLGYILIFTEDRFKCLTIESDSSIYITTYGIDGTTTVSLTDSYRSDADVVKNINSAVSKAYNIVGDIKKPEELTTKLLLSGKEGDVYCVNFGFSVGDGPDQFGDDLFVDSVLGNTYPPGTNIVIVNTGTEEIPKYKFDVLAESFEYEVDISGKADKVIDAVAGNLAGLDETGNLTDSGYKPTDFADVAKVVPIGGTTGQILAKRSSNDNDVRWIDNEEIDLDSITISDLDQICI